MAKITFTADDGSIQEFDVVMTTPPTPVVAAISEVDVVKTDGTEEKFVAQA